MYCFGVGSILLVESDPDTSDEWSTALSAAGHAVLAVSALREALPLLRDGGICVVVIDAYDPRTGIVELARGIEALPDAPPIILLSESPDAPEISARIGAATFLAKPCEPHELVSAVARLLGEIRPVRAFEDEPTGPSRQYG
ncbi:MAG: response regulator receiver protein [Deltaproteobacteria bacterium]|nr:response regulator receiver protein [Deltaproteobacteria bacterium]